jgi:hypothetical protein
MGLYQKELSNYNSKLAEWKAKGPKGPLYMWYFQSERHSRSLDGRAETYKYTKNFNAFCYHVSKQ